MESLYRYVQSQQDKLTQLGLSEVDQPFLHHHAAESTGILLLHGSAATPCNHIALGQKLYEAGFQVYGSLLAGHHDIPSLHRGETPWQECLAGAVEDFLHFQQICSKVFVLGSSFGGTLAYLMPSYLETHAAEYQHRLAGVIALSAPVIANDGWAPTDPWGEEIKGAIQATDNSLPSFRAPLLIGHDISDTLVLPRNGQVALERSRSARKKLIFYAGAGHSLGFAQNTQELAEDIVQFVHHTRSPRHLTFSCKDAKYNHVGLAGSFNNWEPIPLQKAQHGAETLWQGELYLTPGTYNYKLVINQQHWILDPEAEIQPAPHGEKNSYFTIH